MKEACFSTAEACHGHGNEHDCLREDDRHYACRIDFQGDVLTGAAVLTVSDDTFGILHGDFTGTLDKQDSAYGYCEEQDYLDDEHHQAALAAGSTWQTADEFIGERSRESGYDTHQDDEGDAVADSAVGDTLTEPEDEH